MNNINRLLVNICSDNLPETRDFYTTLFDFQVDFDSDWFVHLISKAKQLELGIIDRSSDLVPADYQSAPNGFYVTFVVEDVDELHKLALEKKFSIITEPSDTFYGQRRLLLKDPSGTLVDVSSPLPNG